MNEKVLTAKVWHCVRTSGESSDPTKPRYEVRAGRETVFFTYSEGIANHVCRLHNEWHAFNYGETKEA